MHKNVDDGEGEPVKLVMVVDDSEDILIIMSTIIRQLGFESITFNSPRTALDFLAEKIHYPGMIISDFKMPEMNGVEFLKKAEAIVRIPRKVIYSGNTDIARRTADQKVLCQFWSKPLTIKELKKGINSAMSNKDSSRVSSRRLRRFQKSSSSSRRFRRKSEPKIYD